MSEDEIKKQLEKACILDENCYEVDYLFEEDLQAIRSLWRLYQKEKEKNKKLSEKLTEQICNKVEVEVLEEYRLKLKNSISKDKIRAKIEEIKAKKDFPEFADYEWSDIEKILFHQADILEDLLEEE